MAKKPNSDKTRQAHDLIQRGARTDPNEAGLIFDGATGEALGWHDDMG